MRATAILVSLAVTAAAPALAGPYDTCVLENLRSATVEAAAEGLKEACLNRLTVAVPPQDLPKLTGSATVGPLPGAPPAGKRGHALYITLRNGTGYVIRGLDLSIEAAGGAHVDHVPALYRVPGSHMVDMHAVTLGTNATASFYAPIEEPAGAIAWTIVGASGYLN